MAMYMLLLLTAVCFLGADGYRMVRSRAARAVRLLPQIHQVALYGSKGSRVTASTVRLWPQVALYASKSPADGKVAASRRNGKGQKGVGLDKLNSILRQMERQWYLSCDEFRTNPFGFLAIPVVAALVGYVTNWVGVKMLFYPTQWRGIPFKTWDGFPFGILGWQGIVPAKRYIMSQRMVDVTISQLLDVKEVFSQLRPGPLSKLLVQDVKKGLRKCPSSLGVLGPLIPSPILKLFLHMASKDFILNADKVVDVGAIVVNGLTKDASTLANMFQMVARKELNFLINSGILFGFLLGIIQMIQWMVYPVNWTLAVGGGLVGLVTNWIALKWIFEPLHPTKVGPFIFHGMFLSRQKEVSADFSKFVAKNVLTSKNVWAQLLSGNPTSMPLNFEGIVKRNTKFVLPSIGASTIISQLGKTLSKVSSQYPIHAYTDRVLNLESNLVAAMNKLTPEQFEKVLHPIFQEDEWILILAGGILGMIAGALQWAYNVRSARMQMQAASGEGISDVQLLIDAKAAAAAARGANEKTKKDSNVAQAREDMKKVDDSDLEEDEDNSDNNSDKD